MSKIVLNKITKDYGNSKGVFDLSFEVGEGESFGFVGPNGAGKTTTIRQLMGFIACDSGDASVLGLDCFKSRHLVQAKLGYLPGEIAYFSDMTGAEFIKFCGELRGLKDLTRAHELTEMFEFNPYGKISKMSKGMKQKVAIICAFMHQPEVYILDEPTSGLDPLMQNKFVELVLSEKKRGCTILMSSHSFEEVERTCERVGFIKDGRLKYLGRVEDIAVNKLKIFDVVFKNNLDAARFAEEFSFSCSDRRVRAEVGNLNSFLKSLSLYNIDELNSVMPSLEEFFMQFYTKEQSL